MKEINNGRKMKETNNGRKIFETLDYLIFNKTIFHFLYSYRILLYSLTSFYYLSPKGNKNYLKNRINCIVLYSK